MNTKLYSLSGSELRLKSKVNCDSLAAAQCSALESAIALRLQLKSEVGNRPSMYGRQISRRCKGYSAEFPWAVSRLLSSSMNLALAQSAFSISKIVKNSS